MAGEDEFWQDTFGVIGESMIVSYYTGIALVIGLALLLSCVVWRGWGWWPRMILGLLFLIGAGALYFGFAASLGI